MRGLERERDVSALLDEIRTHSTLGTVEMHVCDVVSFRLTRLMPPEASAGIAESLYQLSVARGRGRTNCLGTMQSYVWQLSVFGP